VRFGGVEDTGILMAMAETVAAQSSPQPLTSSRPGQLDRLAGFRFTYVAIFSFMLLYVASVEVAGPGFVNFRLADAVWHRVLKSVETEGGVSISARVASR